MRLDFKNRSEAVVTLQFDKAKWVVPVGLDGMRRFAPVGPYGLPVATVGGWLSDSEFLLDVDTIANVNHFLFNVRVDGRSTHLLMNEITGEIKDLAVEAWAWK